MSKHSDPCSYFCCSAFRHFEDDELESFDCNLENAIHHIFAPEKFASTPEHLRSKINWELLKPALQLASRFLSMHSVRKHMLDVAYGDLYLSNDVESDDDARRRTRRGRRAKSQDRLKEDAELLCYPRPGLKRSADQIREAAEQLLRGLAAMVDFKFTDKLKESTRGECVKRGKGDLPKKSLPGVESRILLNASILDKIGSAATDPSRHLFALRNCQFWFAETLCHELGHALTKAFYGDGHPEPFVRNRWCSESGYDLANAIFGGIPGTQAIRSSVAYERSYILQEWPSDAIVRNYLLTGCSIGIRKLGAGYTRLFKFPTSLIVKCFREEFWQARELREDFSTLRPRKLPGWIAKHRASNEEVLENMPRNSDVEYEGLTDDDSKKLRRSTRPTKQRVEKKRDRDHRRSKAARINFLRMIEHDEEDFPEDVARDLQNVIRRQKIPESYGSIAINRLRRSFRIERKFHCRRSRHCAMAPWW